MPASDIPQSPADTAEASLSAVVIPLLKGVIYEETNPRLWGQLLILEARVRDYVAVLNLDLALDEAEGYAFLRTRETDENDSEATKLPQLYTRRQLSFPVSLLLALLRKKLVESDTASGDTRLILSRDEITELLRLFLPEHTNEARLVDKIDAHINKIVEMGFLRQLKTRTPDQAPGYEVRRVLKAFIDAQWLSDFNTRLQDYRHHLEAQANEP